MMYAGASRSSVSFSTRRARLVQPLTALARRRAATGHPHVALDQRTLAYAQAVGLDTSKHPGARTEHDQARPDDVAAPLAQHQQARRAHAALDGAVVGDHHKLAGADLAVKVTLDSHRLLEHQAPRDVDAAGDRDSCALLDPSRAGQLWDSERPLRGAKVPRVGAGVTEFRSTQLSHEPTPIRVYSAGKTWQA